MTNTNTIFLSADPNGLTSSSANFVANLAKEKVKSLQTALGNLQFFSTEIKLVGTDAKTETSIGASSETLSMIPTSLEVISKHHQLIAWLREGIKAKESETSAAMNFDINVWLKEQGTTIEELYEKNGLAAIARPVMEDELSVDDVIAKMSIKERNRVYALNAEAAVYGKFIHPEDTRLQNGGHNLAYAREQLMKRLSNPSEVSGNGRDTIVTKYIPSVDLEDVDALFVSLQEKHRSIQAEINGIAHKIELEIQSDKLAKQKRYASALEEYNARETERSRFRQKLVAEVNVIKSERLAAIQSMKIVIPDALKETYIAVTAKVD